MHFPDEEACFGIVRLRENRLQMGRLFTTRAEVQVRVVALELWTIFALTHTANTSLHMTLRATALLFVAGALAFTIQGCGLIGGKSDINRVGKSSSKTGASYREDENFNPKDFKGPETAPGLVFVEGGTFIMGGGEKDLAYNWDNRERQVTVSSFYMDETEVSNVEWKEFIVHVLQDSGQEKYNALLPDTNVWYKDLAYNDPYISYYFQHEGFNTYPVVGVNWYQANEYCKWRTAFVNKLKKEDDEEAVLYPAYRLPSEAEWEYAARGGLEQQNYPWEGKYMRYTRGKTQGQFGANFKRGRGDYAGRSNQGASRNQVEGLNDGYMITAPVRAFLPNDYGLYNMAGNVAEWTFDTYRVLSYEDVDDLNPGRRRGETRDQQTTDVTYRGVEEPNLQSLLFNPDNPSTYTPTPEAATRGFRTNKVEPSAWDRVKVYRGGSWSDVAYYLTTGSRRFFDADSASSTIGFRCAMIRVGSPRAGKNDR